jgi:FMN phosphatase YigB (HAD superfamily)
MTPILLLDLDDTLIENDIDLFLPHYIRAFQGEVKSLIDPDFFSSCLLESTQKMVENVEPDHTLREIFEESFFSKIDVDKEAFQKIADRFYSQVFPTLEPLTKPRQEAIDLVKKAISKEYRLAVATNPLFPLTANLQRLSWAKLSIDEYPFELISSYETFHFAKPNPAFFAEVMARLGWSNSPVIVVGDDLERDIKASHKLGIPTFWVNSDKSDNLYSKNISSKSGGLKDLLPWVEVLSDDALKPDYTLRSAMVAILRATPAALDSFFRDIPVDQWLIRPDEGEWCLTEIICHLRDVEIEVNLQRLKKALNEDTPFLSGENTDTWANDRQYIYQDGQAAFRDFVEARLELIQIILSFLETDWSRMVQHSIFGPTSVEELVRIISSHDRLHINQVYQLINSGL